MIFRVSLQGDEGIWRVSCGIGCVLCHLTVCTEEDLEDPLSNTDQSRRTTGFLQIVAMPEEQGLIMNWGTVMMWCPYAKANSCAFPWTQVLSLWFSAVVHWPHGDGSGRAQVLVCLESGQDMWNKLISDWTSHRPSYDQREGPLRVRRSRKQGAVRRNSRR